MPLQEQGQRRKFAELLVKGEISEEANMRFMFLFLLGAIVVPRAAAQARWQQLPGAAQAYAVDLQSLARKGDILEARIRTHGVGSQIVVQDVQARCAMNQLRTVGEKLYDEDTGRPLPPTMAGDPNDRATWPEYEAGSEGHALLSGLCALARKQNLQEPSEHSLRAA